MPLETELPEIPGHRVISVLGRGGMGVVYAAETREDPPRRVAIKLLRDGAAFDVKVLRRFVREGALGRALSHENILPVRALGEAGGQPYMVMDCVDGRSVAQVLATRAHDPSSVHVALHALVQAARALDYAHGHGVVHRDVKPGNILVQGDGRAWLIDFGLARELDSDTQLTSSGVTVGTPWYMSPEQLGGERAKIGPQSDVYALGVCVYEAATGRVPFHATTWEELRRKVGEQEPPRFAASAPAVAHELRALEPIALKALEKRPEHRYASAGALADDLERVIAGLPASSHALELSLRRGWRGVLRQKWKLVAGVVTALAVAGALVSWKLAVARAEHREMEIGGLYLGSDLSLERHDYQDALASLDRAIELDPQKPESYLRRATAYVELDRTFDAHADVDRAIDRGFDPSPALQKTPLDRYRYALYLMTSRRYAAAADALREFTDGDLAQDRELRKRLYAAYFSRFRVEMRLGRRIEARRSLDAYRSHLRDEGELEPILASQVHELDGKLEDAVQDLESVLASPPRDTSTVARVHRRLGRLLLLLGRRTAAAVQFHAALDIDSRQSTAWAGLAIVHMELARVTNDARRHLPRAHWTFVPALARVLVRLSRKEVAAAEAAADRCLQLEPKHVQAREILADVAATQNEFSKALSLTQEALACEPDNAEVLDLMYLCAYRRGEELYLGGNARAARFYFDQVLAYDPFDVGSNFYLGLDRLIVNAFDEAASRFQAAQRGLEIAHMKALGTSTRSARVEEALKMRVSVWLNSFCAVCQQAASTDEAAACAWERFARDFDADAIAPDNLLNLAEVLATSAVPWCRDRPTALRITARHDVQNLRVPGALELRQKIEAACR